MAYSPIDVVHGLEELDIESLTMDERFLVQAARDAKELAHAPYSNFRVGAAIATLGHLGGFVRGANWETSTYGAVHAEQAAIVVAQSRGCLDKIRKIAIAGDDVEPITPCGGCRQNLVEVEAIGHHPVTIIMAGTGDKIWRVVGVNPLLPLHFRPANLAKQ